MHENKELVRSRSEQEEIVSIKRQMTKLINHDNARFKSSKC